MDARRELVDVQRRLRSLQKKRSSLRLARARTKLVPVQRYPPSSQTSLFVFVHSGCSTDLTVDFVAGRGWWKGSPSCHLSASQRQDLAAQIEWAYIRASLDDIVALELEPHKLCTWAERVCGVKYIVEHALFNWVQKQNMEQGVAPSRSQLVDQALASIPTLIPLDLQNHARRVLASSDRSQRRWLSLFRRRWGARLGVLKPCSALPLEEKQRKARMKLFSFMCEKTWVLLGAHFWVHCVARKLGAMLFCI